MPKSASAKSTTSKSKPKVSQKRLAAIAPVVEKKEKRAKKAPNPELEKAKKKLQAFRDKQKQYKTLVKDTSDFIKSIKSGGVKEPAVAYTVTTPA